MPKLPFFRGLFTLLAVVLLAPIATAEEPAKEAAAQQAAKETTIDLTPKFDANDLTHVTYELSVGGKVFVKPKDDSGQGDEGDKKQETKELPMSVEALLVFDESRVLANDGKSAKRGIRYYDRAEAALKVDKTGQWPHLGDERRIIIADNTGGRLYFWSPKGILERSQLDLVDVIGDPLAIDALLPTKPVADGDIWEINPNAVATLLSLDTVANTQVTAVLDKFNSDYALVKVAGTAIGTTDGATTEMEVRGVYLFDRKLHRIAKFNLAVQEKRAIGAATPGLDSVAKLKMEIKPIEASVNLPEATLAPLRSAEGKKADMLKLDEAKQGYRILHDRQWFITSQDRETTTLRRVEQGDVVAQCTITSLPPKTAEHPTTLEEFEKDIRFSLKESFGQLVSSKNWSNAFGHHCYEVVVRGKAQDIPVEWHYYLVAPETGNRVAVAVTIDGQMVNRLNNADPALVNAIQLLPPAEVAAAKTADAAANAANEKSLLR